MARPDSSMSTSRTMQGMRESPAILAARSRRSPVTARSARKCSRTGDGLDKAVFRNAGCKALKLLAVEHAPGLIGVRVYFADGYLADPAAPEPGPGQKRLHRHSSSMPVLVHIILPTFGKNPRKMLRGKPASEKSGGPVIDQSAKTGCGIKI